MIQDSISRQDNCSVRPVNTIPHRLEVSGPSLCTGEFDPASCDLAGCVENGMLSLSAQRCF